MRRIPELSAASALCASLCASLSLNSSPARAQVTLSSGAPEPVEQRIAVALGPTRSVVWVAAHARPAAGAFALVVPARSGASIDVATDAWLEALEAATAPRILPPPGIEPTCPGDPPSDPFHVAGDLEHHATLAPVETVTLEGAADLLLWAAQNELTVSGPVAAALADSDASHFVALRFASPGGDAWTPTVRVAFAGPEPILPLSLAQAGSDPQIVTLFAFSEGRAAPEGALVELDPAELTFDVARARTDYRDVLGGLLAPPGTFAVESASHDVLVSAGGLPGGATIPSLVGAYYQRAVDLGAASGDPDACAAAAASAIERPERFAEACPRADLGVIDGQGDCFESPTEDETDPAALRCGGDADDLALALSGLEGEGAWLTRISLRIAAGETGAETALSAAPGDAVDPVLVAGSADFSDCDEGGGGQGGSGATSSADAGAGGQNGAGPTGSAGPGGLTTGASGDGPRVTIEVPVRVYDTGCGCSGDYVIVDYIEVYEDEVPASGSYYAEDDGCDGDTSESYETSEVESSPDEGGCNGETSETSDSESSGDGCSGDTSESSGDDSDDGTSDDTSDDGSDGSSESGDDSGCGCDDESTGSEEAAARHTRQLKAMRARPRFSIVAFGIALLLAPLRRLTRKRAPAELGAKPRT